MRFIHRMTGQNVDLHSFLASTNSSPVSTTEHHSPRAAQRTPDSFHTATERTSEQQLSIWSVVLQWNSTNERHLPKYTTFPHPGHSDGSPAKVFMLAGTTVHRQTGQTRTQTDRCTVSTAQTTTQTIIAH